MSSSKAKTPKRNPRRNAKDRWEEQKLMTSSNSPLVGLDLVKLLADPRAWTCLEESEKKEILNLLPEDLYSHTTPPSDDPDAKIPPLPESFLRYSNHWRDGIRQFQLDLEQGRYDPVWLREAEEAMQQRAEGKFDKFKEEEFEQFWGQKQKMDKTLAAGQSRQVKLSTLIEQGVVRGGDIWKYSRAFSKGANRVLVEKEVRILDAKDGSLTVAFPPGQKVFLSTCQSSKSKDSVAEDKSDPEQPQPDATTAVKTELDKSTEASVDVHSDAIQVPETSPRTKRKPKTEAGPRKRQRGNSSTALTQEATTEGVQAETQPEDASTTQPVLEHGTTELPISDIAQSAPMENNNQAPADATQQVPDVAENKPEEEDVDEIIISGITQPNAIGNKILETDGRVREVPHGNAWKEFRAYRDNQDMGSLWEVRQAWFVKAQKIG
ncbi:Asx homology domain-containing protein [Aspergillus avenaceus]|uniref:Asx homology domain-containing protein n=1 Tax=Aspergillus avenaceus TaxID=36643 RepID=A0A5N6TQA5_ASPAV|nr:Asx homology domain-containing protein [Aspergillus avenaceus]